MRPGVQLEKDILLIAKYEPPAGEPTIADTLGNRTTGHELTFYLANDSIVVDSQNDSRTEDKPDAKEQ